MMKRIYERFLLQFERAPQVLEGMEGVGGGGWLIYKLLSAVRDGENVIFVSRATFKSVFFCTVPPLRDASGQAEGGAGGGRVGGKAKKMKTSKEKKRALYNKRCMTSGGW